LVRSIRHDSARQVTEVHYQGLIKLPDLVHIELIQIYQKYGPLTPIVLPDACCNGHLEVQLEHDRHGENIKAVLDAMATHLHVCLKRRKPKYRGMVYYEVCLSRVPMVVTHSREDSLRRYAGELEGI
jgi:hypothetical protein